MSISSNDHAWWGAWGSFPIVFRGYPMNFKATQVNTLVVPIWIFQKGSSNFTSHMPWNDIHSFYWPFQFWGHHSNFKVTWAKKNGWFDSDLNVSTWQLQFEYTDGNEMTHIATRISEEVHAFQGHTSNLKSHRPNKITRLVTAIKSLRFALLIC